MVGFDAAGTNIAGIFAMEGNKIKIAFYENAEDFKPTLSEGVESGLLKQVIVDLSKDDLNYKNVALQAAGFTIKKSLAKNSVKSES